MKRFVNPWKPTPTQPRTEAKTVTFKTIPSRENSYFAKKREKKRRKGSSGEQKERKKEMASICKWQFGIKLDPSYSGRRLQRRRRRQQCQKRRQRQKRQQQQQYGGGRVERTEGEETENLASCNESFKNIEKQWFLSKKLAIHWKDLSQSISLRGETEWCDVIGHTRNEEVQLFWVATIAFINCLGGKTSDFPWGRCGFGSQVRWTRRLKKCLVQIKSQHEDQFA